MEVNDAGDWLIVINTGWITNKDSKFNKCTILKPQILLFPLYFYILFLRAKSKIKTKEDLWFWASTFKNEFNKQRFYCDFYGLGVQKKLPKIHHLTEYTFIERHLFLWANSYFYKT